MEQISDHSPSVVNNNIFEYGLNNKNDAPGEGIHYYYFLLIFEFRERNCFWKKFTQTMARARIAFDLQRHDVPEVFSISETLRIDPPLSLSFSMDRIFCFFSKDATFLPKVVWCFYDCTQAASIPAQLHLI